VKLALDPQMFCSSSSVYGLPDIVASLGCEWMELSPTADFIPFSNIRGSTTPGSRSSRSSPEMPVSTAVDFDGVISSCVFGWEEDARGVSERQRDKALALIGKHLGDDAAQSLEISKIDR
jgi:hypothetical protein